MRARVEMYVVGRAPESTVEAFTALAGAHAGVHIMARQGRTSGCV